MVEEIFKETIKKHQLLKKKDRLILGVSGGSDSVCMLYLFLRIKKEYRLNLICTHFNHQLRREADEEEEFVSKLCEKEKIKFISERKEVKKFFCGDSLEQTARNLRYDFFLKVARQTKIKKLALAHHKDDLAETVLMRFIKGAGLRGLRGFLPKTKFKNLVIIRPLIQIRKKDILNWLEKSKIAYCIDKTNLEEKFLRNYLRLKISPLLEKINPNIVDNLSNLAKNLSYDYDFIYKFSHHQFQLAEKGKSLNEVRLDLEKLKKLHPAILNNVIRIAIEETKGNLKRLENRHLEEIEDLILNRPPQSIVHLPFLLAKKEKEDLVIQTLILNNDKV
ncbi:MAG TPA: tRNA lysidine(34) synthetase TilS [Candidatus Omnitrophica bacterium]|nr:tRNA lysidine(34) synthetase TilS [Candidatus Omnitrophota bacterium]